MFSRRAFLVLATVLLVMEFSACVCARDIEKSRHLLQAPPSRPPFFTLPGTPSASRPPFFTFPRTPSSPRPFPFIPFPPPAK
ncbi:hypothetical protein SUGI_0674060 [Cryptomeria japonica]|nr:hypothetical protein SUGI_0674060 [Cryptomeria japonica]